MEQTTTFQNCPECASKKTSGVFQASAFDDAPAGFLSCQCHRCSHTWSFPRSKTHPRRFGLSTFRIKERELLQRISAGEIFSTSIEGWKAAADSSEKIPQHAMASLISQRLVLLELKGLLAGGAPWYEAKASLAGREALATRRVA